MKYSAHYTTYTDAEGYTRIKTVMLYRKPPNYGHFPHLKPSETPPIALIDPPPWPKDLNDTENGFYDKYGRPAWTLIDNPDYNARALKPGTTDEYGPFEGNSPYAFKRKPLPIDTPCQLADIAKLIAALYPDEIHLQRMLAVNYNAPRALEYANFCKQLYRELYDA